MKCLILLMIGIKASIAVTNSLDFFTTASSGVPIFPEYVHVWMLDGVEIACYDSDTRKAVAKQDWMNNATADDPDYWETWSQRIIGRQQLFKIFLDSLKQQFNHTGGIHILQNQAGCSWDEETGDTESYSQIGYDGGDFLSFDLKTLSWIANVPEGVVAEDRLNNIPGFNDGQKHFLTRSCFELLKKFLEFGKRTVPPSVSLLQKTPSSPVTCHATGFYPNELVMFWRRDEQHVYEDVDNGELLPNHDGTFQRRSQLLVKPEVWEENHYDCVVQLSGMEDIVIKLERSVIKTNRVNPDPAPAPLGLIIGVVVGLLVMAAIVIFIVVYVKKKRTSEEGSDDASISSSNSNTMQGLSLQQTREKQTPEEDVKSSHLTD